MKALHKLPMMHMELEVSVETLRGSECRMKVLHKLPTMHMELEVSVKTLRERECRVKETASERECCMKAI